MTGGSHIHPDKYLGDAWRTVRRPRADCPRGRCYTTSMVVPCPASTWTPPQPTFTVVPPAVHEQGREMLRICSAGKPIYMYVLRVCSCLVEYKIYLGCLGVGRGSLAWACWGEQTSSTDPELELHGFLLTQAVCSKPQQYLYASENFLLFFLKEMRQIENFNLIIISLLW